MTSEIPVTRNIFSLGGLILIAERELRKTPEGWRFCQKDEPTNDGRRMSMSWVPIEVQMAENGSIRWRPSTRDTGKKIYERESGEEEKIAMTEALNDLLRDMSL